MYIIFFIVDEKPFTVGPFSDFEKAKNFGQQYGLQYWIDYCISTKAFEREYLPKAEVL